MLGRLYRYVERTVVQSWWVIACFLIAYVFFDYAVELVEGKYEILFEKKQKILLEKNQALEKQKELQFEVASQKDHRWMELTLMKGLGVVPEGQTKVFFKKPLEGGSKELL